jgi:hypothetical protein
MQKISSRLFLLAALGTGLVAAEVRAQFTAFNDHYSGAGTHSNTTTWNVYGTAGGAPGNAGLLREITTGATLPVTLTITNLAVSGGTTAGGPNVGTPAYVAFNGFIDWGNGTVNHAVQTPPGAVVSHVFTGLNPVKRYRYTCSAVRAGGYTDRWIRIALVGAQAFTTAHTGGCLTNGTPGATVAANECALSSGDNTAGDLAVWENIQPAADGSFTIMCTQYQGPVPGGSSAGSYGYSIAAEKIEEFDTSPAPVTITVNPVDQTVGELKSVSFSGAAIGNPLPRFQWFKNSSPVSGATNATYSVASVPLADHGAVFFLVASNWITNVSFLATSAPATLTVLADTNSPAVVTAFSLNGTAVQISFSEPVTAATATNLANYVLTNSAGALAITGATLAGDGTNVTLTTAAQTLGSTYTLRINGIRDLSAAANVIATNTLATFLAQSYVTSDIGAPGSAGTFTVISGTAYDVGASGADFGGTADQFTLVQQPKSGDFDVAVRVDALTAADPWSKAALMARETLAANSVFAASVATPMVGAFFQGRSTNGAAAASAGNFPPVFPDMWLRLKRAGNVFTGYGSADGRSWVSLGSATLTVGTVYLGFAVTSHNNTNRTLAQFRDYGDTATNAAVVTSVAFASEPLSACSRTTPLVISEIMYNPAPGAGTNSLEFIELYNSNPFFEDLGGYRLSGEIDFTFPQGTVLGGGQFLVVAKDPAYAQSVYGLTGVLGPYTNSLGGNGTIRLRNDVNAVMLTVEYADGDPWPTGADGTGHSLVLVRASYGENDPRAWEHSFRKGGSPGRPEPVRIASGLGAVVINEFLANSELPLLDFVELYNHSAAAVDISGCWLSDDPVTNKFRVPTNTVLAAGGFIAFNELQLGFALKSSGDNIYLRSADGTRLLDTVRYEAQESGIAMGRSPDGSADFHRLAARTAGTNNAAFLVHDVVINELMYGPISEDADDQYVELFNKGTNAISLRDWKFVHGIGYKFPDDAVLPPGGYVVVARKLPQLLAKYPHLGPTNAFGDFSGRLSRGGERVAVARPDYYTKTNGGVVVTNMNSVIVDEVTYKPGGRWGKWADQGGSSLELIDPRSNHRMAFSWGDSDETGKAPWTKIEAVGVLDHGNTYQGSPIDRLEVTMLGEGECLIDDFEVFAPGGLNLVQNAGFESGLLSPWTPQGNHVATMLGSSGRSGLRSMHIRTSGNGDTGGNRIRVALTSPLTAGTTNVTMRAYARWQRGWPEVLLRLKGNYMEAYGALTLPTNLGTPGGPNSRAATNNAPAIAGVVHAPILPAASEAVVVTARVHDPDGVNSATLYYRLDSSPGFSSTLMNDNGVGGDAVARDGIYSATLAGQAAGTLIAFYVEARDVFNAASQFPENAGTQAREALVRWGDPVPVSAFATYRMWMTAANVATHISRPAVSNQDVDGTMVINNYRVIYNMGTHYGGSPYHQGQNSSPVSGNVHYQASVPKDDMYLGTASFNKLHAPGNGAFDDGSLMREQISFWFVRKLGLPYLYRRYFAMYVNGNRKGGANALMEDSQRPGGEMIDQWYPDENEGRLYKEQPWFEWDDVNVTGGTGAGFENKRWCQLTTFVSTNAAHKKAAYRHTWLTRSADVTANDYNEVFALCSVSSLGGGSPLYWQSFNALVDVEQWAKTFAVEHAVGNWDSFGSQNSQNLYGYKPKNGKWKQFIWDYNIVLGNSGSWGPGVNLFNYNTADSSMGVLNSHPPFRRAWVRAYKELTVGPKAAMLAANCDPVIDARSTAFSASGLTPSVSGATVKSWIASARSAIEAVVATYDTTNFAVSTTSIVASSNLVTISGVAPLDVIDIKFNGSSWTPVWSTTTNWTVTIPVTSNTVLNVAAYNKAGQAVGATNQVNVTYAGAAPAPVGFVMFSEIMFRPLVEDGDYIELFNSHSNVTFDLSGWRINGADYTFPAGSFIPPRAYRVLARDRATFAVTYGVAVPVMDVFTGNLQGDGETLTLIKTGATPAQDVVVDKVRYESVLPWPTNTYATGSSLQLIDNTQDNVRVGNWGSRYVPAVYTGGVSTPATTNIGWRFMSMSTNASSTPRLLIYLDGPGSVFLDDIVLVPGTNAGVGTNMVNNGGFEQPLETISFYSTNYVTNVNAGVTNVTTNVNANSWSLGTNMTAAVITNEVVRSGNGALKLVVQGGFSVATNKMLYQNLLGPITPASGQPYTLSFWCWATNTTGSSNLTARLQGASLNIVTNIGVIITPSNYVPPGLVSAATNYASPGASNQVAAVLPAFQNLWINEVQAENVSGPADSYGERGSWIEVFNPGTNAVSLDGLFLSTNFTSLTNWAFPSGHTVPAGGFKVIFCDNQPAQTSNAEIHAAIQLAPGSGFIALSRVFNGQPQVLDYVNYKELHANYSFGSVPDGQPFDRQEFFYFTPGATNDPRSAPLVVFINEWMAGNTNSLADPADADFEDWFEIYNPNASAVNLAGYYLTDSLTNKFQHLITTNGPHIIPPHGHLLVWADNETGQNMSGGVPRTDLHVSFRLNVTGEVIAMFAADGTLIDAVSFGPQTDDVSEGRYPDGNVNLVVMPGTSTPRAANSIGLATNTPPVLDPVGNKVVYLGQTLAFTATASDADLPAQALNFTLDPGAPPAATISGAGAFAWTPAAPGHYSVTVRVTDSGTPQASDTEAINIEVVNHPAFTGFFRNGSNFELSWETRPGRIYRIEYKDDLGLPGWSLLQDITATGNLLSLTNGTAVPQQRFYRVTVLP